jgi:carboxyl-terminal processing protease
MRKILFVGFIGMILMAAPPEGIAASSDTYRQLDLFGDVFERVRSDFVEEVDDGELIEAAINGMLSSLDPHSSYLTAKKYRDMQVQTRGEFGGLGIEVTMENGLVKVISPIDDTPAFRAGVKAGDLVTHIDDEPVLGLTLAQAVDKMRGPVDSVIVITVARRGADKPLKISITRAIIKIQSVRFRAEEDVAYIRITSFNEQTESGVEKAMKKLRADLGAKYIGMVLDLRNNPGGLLDQAIAVSDAFLDQGEIVSTRGRRNEDTTRYNANRGDLAAGKPIIVLVNGGSASASEIVAGALQDHRRALVLGTKSFGKGSVQTIIPLGSHGAMRLTTARYYTPSGNSIQAKGIVPDIVVEQARIESLEQTSRRSEADLRGHLENDNGDEDAAVKDEDEAKEDAPQDYQLTRALDLLRGLSLLGNRVADLGVEDKSEEDR